MQAEYNLIILGGGCAGLSVAMQLAALGPGCPRTLILESRTEYTNDRTWCFWDDGSTKLRHLIRHRWQTMTVQSASRSVTVDCGLSPYQMIPADAFYGEALHAISSSARIDLVMRTCLLSEPYKLRENWQIETSEGIRSGTTVIDTRPLCEPKRGGALLWQSFYGHEIECDEPVFDPTRMDLMDFTDDDATRILFNYVLPLSPNRALVETTVFGPDPIDPEHLAHHLQIAIARLVHGATFTIVRSETGILPMGGAAAKIGPDATYVKAGLTAGGARPTTGYAFQRIQRWAEACARGMGEGKLPIGHAVDPPLLRAMDHLFLSVLRARPEAASSLFVSLFEKTNPASMIRFLSDCGTLTDYASIISALPIVPFLEEIPRALLTGIPQRKGSMSQ